MDYNLVKWLHIVSSTVLFGTGIGSAYYMLFTSLGGDARDTAAVTRLVVRADWCFTTPTAIFQPLSGLYLVHLAGFPLDSPWIAGSLGLYALAIAAWLPVVWIQIRLRDMASEAAARDEPLSRRYWRFLELWTLLGALAFFAFLTIFWLMVNKMQ